MAQDISLLGAVYSDVPSVLLPKQGGGTAQFDDTTDADATASDILSGKTAYVNGVKITGTGGGGSANIQALSITQNGTYTASGGVDGYSPVTVNVSGSSGSDKEDDDVVFLDYDGTIVYSYTATEFASLTEMPSNPSHTGLTAQGWNWTLTDAKAYVASYGAIDIGQMYKTNDGTSRFYMELPDGIVDIAIRAKCSVAGGAEIDWGDGSTRTSLTTTVTTHTHTYSASGNYVIKIYRTSGTVDFTSMSSTNGIFGGAGYKQRGGAFCKRIEFDSNVTFSNYAFNVMYGLETITIPKEVTSLGNYFMADARSLKALVIPSSVTTIGSSSLTYNQNLEHISFPKGITSSVWPSNPNSLRRLCIPPSTAQTSWSTNSYYFLLRFVLPEGYTTLSSNNVLGSLFSLKKLTIPSTVTSMNASYVFSNDYSLKEIHMKPTSPPTLGANMLTNVSTTTNPDLKIYVPYSADHSILEAYKTASNWSGRASIIVEEPQ